MINERGEGARICGKKEKEGEKRIIIIRICEIF